MTIKELIKELNQYDENLEIVISIDNKEENRIEVNKINNKIFITKDSKVRIDELQNEIKRMKFESLLSSLAFESRFMGLNNYLNLDNYLTWDEKMRRLGSKMNGYDK